MNKLLELTEEELEFVIQNFCITYFEKSRIQ